MEMFLNLIMAFVVSINPNVNLGGKAASIKQDCDFCISGWELQSWDNCVETPENGFDYYRIAEYACSVHNCRYQCKFFKSSHSNLCDDNWYPPTSISGVDYCEIEDYCPWCFSAPLDQSSEKFKRERAIMLRNARSRKFKPEDFKLTQSQLTLIPTTRNSEQK